MKGFGKLMFATHEGLSKLYEVSCSELDFLVDQAKLFPAVIGSRLMGGGFGGCTINLVEVAGVENFIQQTNLAYQQQFNILSEAYIVNTSDGTASVPL
jgi:galactokinase